MVYKCQPGFTGCELLDIARSACGTRMYVLASEPANTSGAKPFGLYVFADESHVRYDVSAIVAGSGSYSVLAAARYSYSSQSDAKDGRCPKPEDLVKLHVRDFHLSRDDGQLQLVRKVAHVDRRILHQLLELVQRHTSGDDSAGVDAVRRHMEAVQERAYGLVVPAGIDVSCSVHRYRVRNLHDALSAYDLVRRDEMCGVGLVCTLASTVDTAIAALAQAAGIVLSPAAV